MRITLRPSDLPRWPIYPESTDDYGWPHGCRIGARHRPDRQRLLIPDKVLERLRSQIPVGRLGRPEDIARVVAFLAADDSSYITGQIWAVNGGLDM